MFKKTLMVLSLSAALLTSAVLPATHAAAQAAPSATIQNASSSGEVGAVAKSGTLVKLALVITKTAVKYGGDLAAFILNSLDPETAKYLSKNTGIVIKGIDLAIKKFDNETKYTSAEIRTIVQDSLRSVNLPDKYLVDVTNAIVSAVDSLLENWED